MRLEFEYIHTHHYFIFRDGPSAAISNPWRISWPKTYIIYEGPINQAPFGMIHMVTSVTQSL